MFGVGFCRCVGKKGKTKTNMETLHVKPWSGRLFGRFKPVVFLTSSRLKLGCLAAAAILWSTSPAGAVGTWTALTHASPGLQINNMLLMSDGTVLAHDVNSATTWYRLTPDTNGSYINGTWTSVASMSYTREYFSSQVLTNGGIFVAGGEYGNGGYTGEIYDPLANVWIAAPSTPGTNKFIDSGSAMLPNGNVIIAPVTPANYGETLIWNTATTNWSVGPTLYRGDDQDEASWVTLPDGSIITIDPFGQNSERYIPSLNKWINDTTVPVSMYGWGGELGPGLMLPNGKAFFMGGTNHTAIYTPSGTTNAGSWAAGPDIPNGYGVIDGPGAMLINGKILCCVGTNGSYGGPSYFYEYDYTTNGFAPAPSPTSGTLGASFSPAPFVCSMLELPNGQVLLSHENSSLYVYTPDGSPLSAGKPAISSISANGDGSYHVTGTLFNGISSGAAYGDDQQMNSNYPLGRTTNSAGNVVYARTYNWNHTGVMTGTNLVSTELTMPASLTPGSYPLSIVANGISSDPMYVNYPAGVTWDANTSSSGAQDGSGTWNSSNANWWNGTSDVTWNDATPYIAYIGSGGTAGTITVSGAHTNSWLIFNPVSGAYTLSGSGSLTLSNGITANDSATISVPLSIATSQTWTIATNQTLSVNGTLSASGTMGLSLLGAGTLNLGGNNQVSTNISVLNFVDANNNTTLNIASGTETFMALNLNDSVVAEVTGNGTLVVNGASDLKIGGEAASQSQVLDLSGLNNFTYNASGNNFFVGSQTSGVTGSGILYLAATNSITAGAVDVQTTSGGTSTQSSGYLFLGQNNTLNASTINVALNRDIGTLEFPAGTTNPVLVIRASDGVSRANINIGSRSSSYFSSMTGTLDLSTNVTGTCALDGLVGTLMIANETYCLSGSDVLNGNFAMTGGTLDATTITIGEKSNASSQGIGIVNGTFTQGGGTVKVSTLILGDRTTGDTNTLNATYNFNGGTLNAQSITPGANTATRNLNWNNGVIGNYDASTDLAIASGLTITLSPSSTETFTLGSGRTGTVNSVLSGSGSLNENGNGTLVLTAANTYKGTTTVSGGTLQVDGSLGTNTLTVQSSATLAGAGTINGATTVQAGGTLAPGDNAIGTLTVNNTLTLSGTALMAINKTAASSDLAQGISTITYGGSLVVTNLSGTLAAGDSFTLFSAGSYAGTFSSLTFPALAGGLTWDTSQLGVNGSITVAGLATITVVPASTNLVYGNSVTLTALANGTPPLSFQWYDNNGNVIPGATGTNLTLTAPGVAASGNYSVSVTDIHGSTTNFGTVTVSPASLTVTANNTNRVYGAANPAFTASYSGFVNGDTNSVLSGSPSLTTIASAGSPVGSYAINASAGSLSAANYSFVFNSGTLAVSSAALTVTANNLGKNYGQNLNFAGTEFTSSGLVNSDTVTNVTLTSTGATNTASVGTYSIVPSNAQGNGLTNYTISYNNGTLTVAAATLLVAANNTNRIYGATNPVFTASYSGFVNGDTSAILTGSPNLATTATTNSSVGAYTITTSQGTLSVTNNYAFSFTNGTLTVNSAALTITAANTNKLYGQTVVFAGTEFTSSGLLNNDTLTTVTLASAGATNTATAGTYPIVPSAAQGSGLTNYTISYVNGTFNVSPTTLLVSANNTNRLYGAVNPAFTASYSGFVNGETPAVLSGVPALTTTATTNSSVGTYVISAGLGTLADNNYSFTFSNGTLTVNSAALTITANSTNKLYGQNLIFAGTEFASSGLVNSDTVTNVTLTSTGATNTAATGTYPIVPSNALGTGLANYTINYVNGTLTVYNPAPGTPQSLTATAISSNQISLNWSPATNATGYIVNRGGTAVATTATNNYLDTGLTPGTPYVYTVTATNLAGVSSNSAPASATTSVQGVTLTWDATGSTSGAQDGSGTWSTSNATWLYGTNNIGWFDNNVAAFGVNTTTNCTVTLANDVTPSGINFNATGGGTYTIAGSNNIWLTNTVAVAMSANGTINAVLNGSGSLTKNGTNILTLGGANNYTGVTTVNAGTLRASASGALPSATVLNFHGASSATLDLQGSAQTVAGLIFTNLGTSTFTFTGTSGSLLSVSASNLLLAPFGTTNTLTVNMSGLSSFVYSNPAGTFTANNGVNAASSSTGQTTVTLAGATNSITASSLNVGNKSPSSGVINSTLYLGTMANTFDVDVLNLGSGRGDGSILFPATTNNPALTIIGSDGVSPATLVLGGYHDSFQASDSPVDVIDTTPGTLNALFGSATIGIDSPAANMTGSRGINSSSSFKMGAGTLTAASMTLGVINSASGDTNSYSYNITNTALLSLTNGGTATITTLALANNNYTGNLTSSSKLSATVSLTNGAALYAATIQKGSIATPNSGTLNVTAQITWGDGTIGNIPGGDLNVSGVAVSLAGTATAHTFNITSGQVGTVSSVLSGTGAISVTGGGTLVLSGNNTYSGTTTVSGGTLQVDGAIGTNTVTVQSGSMLSGTGTINGATTIQSGGTLSPGDGGIGTLAIGNSLTLSGTVLATVSKSGSTLANDEVTSTSSITYGGSLVVTNTGATALAAGDSFTLFSGTGYAGGFSSVSLPSLNAGLYWYTNNLSVNGTISVSNFTYTLTYTSGANGSISGTSPQTVNYGGSGTAVTPTPNSGYRFVNWSDGSTANPRTDTGVTSNISVTANFTASTTNYGTLMLSFGPNSYWRLGETNGSAILHDATTNAHNATPQGIGLTLGVAGPQSPAFPEFESTNTGAQFNGASNWISAGTAASLSGSNDFTVVAWVKTTATTGGVVIQQRDTGYNGEYQLMVNASGGVSFFAYGNSAYSFNFTANRTVNDGQWHSLMAGRKNGTNGFIYVDGALAASVMGTNEPLLSTIGTYIGRDVRDNVNNFNGQLDEVAIFTRALSTNEIAQLSNTNLYGLPTPWTTNAVGTIASEVTATYFSKAFIVGGTGTGLATNTDNFWLLDFALTNNVTITALVTSQQTNNVAPLAGVMIRQSTNAGSAFAFMGLSSTNQGKWIYRTTNNAVSSSTTFTNLPTPYWVRLIRGTNTFTGYVSADGSTWTTAASLNITMSSNVLVGLAVSSGTTNTLNTAVFNNVTVTNGGVSVFQPPLAVGNATAQLQSFVVGDGSASFTISGDDGSVWLLEESDDLVNWTPIETLTLIGGGVSQSQADDARPARFFRVVPAQ